MKIWSIIAIATSAIAVGAAGAVAYLEHKDREELAEKLGKSLADLANKAEIDIPEELIRNSIAKAVDRHVNSALDSAADKAVREIKSQIAMTVKVAVDKETKDLSVPVKAKLETELNNIDISSLKNEVMNKARDRVIQHFEDDINDILASVRTRADNKLQSSVDSFKRRMDRELDRVHDRVNGYSLDYKFGSER